MGSATRGALATSVAELASRGAVSLDTAEQLFAAGRIIGSTAQLRTLLVDPSIDSAAKETIIERIFARSFDVDTLGLLTAVAVGRWSSADDLLAGIEELGLRAAAISLETAPAEQAESPEPAVQAAATTTSSVLSAGAKAVDAVKAGITAAAAAILPDAVAPSDPSTVTEAGGSAIERELFAFEAAVKSDPALELALGSKLGDLEPKVELVDRLLVGATAQTRAIVGHLVQQPRGRRIRELLRHAAAIVADESGHAIATVRTARPLGDKQVARLSKALSARYGERLTINQIIDPELIGGLRVAIGDEIIDGSVATRLADLRLQLSQ